MGTPEVKHKSSRRKERQPHSFGIWDPKNSKWQFVSEILWKIMKEVMTSWLVQPREGNVHSIFSCTYSIQDIWSVKLSLLVLQKSSKDTGSLISDCQATKGQNFIWTNRRKQISLDLRWRIVGKLHPIQLPTLISIWLSILVYMFSRGAKDWNILTCLLRMSTDHADVFSKPSSRVW